MHRSLVITLLVALFSCASFTSCCNECEQDFYNTIEKEIAAIDVKIKELQAKAAGLSEDAKAEFAVAIEKLKKLKEEAKVKLAALKSAGSEAWKEMKPALNDAMTDLKDGFEKAKTHFK